MNAVRQEKALKTSNDPVGWLALADLLTEQGRDEEAAEWRRLAEWTRALLPVLGALAHCGQTGQLHTVLLPGRWRILVSVKRSILHLSLSCTMLPYPQWIDGWRCYHLRKDFLRMTLTHPNGSLYPWQDEQWSGRWAKLLKRIEEIVDFADSLESAPQKRSPEEMS